MIIRTSAHYFEATLRTKHDFGTVVLVEGARQVGKTSLIKQVLQSFNGVVSINLETDKIFRAEIDKTKSFEEFAELLRIKFNFKGSEAKILFIDEAQESRLIGGYVRSIKESWSKALCILSGSSMSKLFNDNTRVPVGRIDRFKLGPFTFFEFLQATSQHQLLEIISNFAINNLPSAQAHRELLAAYDNYLTVGGLPEAVLSFAAKEDFALARRSIFLNQEDDFSRKEPSHDRDLFSMGLRAVANNLGSPSKYTHVGVRHEQAKKILSTLRAWHLITEIQHHSVTIASNFTPKRYLYDIGIAQLLRSMPFPTLSLLNTKNALLRTALGGLFENAILLSLETYKMGNADISGWKNSSKDLVEVDFVWRETQPIPIECKASLKISNREFGNVKRYLKLCNLKFGVVASAAPFQIIGGAQFKLVNIPIYLFSPELVVRVRDEIL